MKIVKEWLRCEVESGRVHKPKCRSEGTGGNGAQVKYIREGENKGRVHKYMNGEGITLLHKAVV